MSNQPHPGMRVSEFLLQECVGRGTFGQVWRARHHLWEREVVAIKLPTDPEYVRYLQREGVLAHGLRHPNIVRVQGIDPFADPPYLVMEFVDGLSLRELIQRHPRGMPLPAVVGVLRGLLQGLEFAHAAGVIHRDLKPGNILLAGVGRDATAVASEQVRLTDFGLGSARNAPGMLQSASLVRDDALVGTLAYLAPELRDGTHAPDARTDLYAVGVLLFEMLTGERPAGAELPGTLRAGTPPELDQLFRRLFAGYARRFESAAAVLVELEPLDSGGSRARRTPPPVPASIPSSVDASPCPAHGGDCPGCGGRTGAGDQFCIHCGRQLVAALRRCDHCGGFPGPNDRFCILCGHRLAVAAR